MIGIIINALIALGITYWFLGGEELTVADPLGIILFLALLTSLELSRLHRKVDLLSKRRKHEVNWKEMQEGKDRIPRSTKTVERRE